MPGSTRNYHLTAVVLIAALIATVTAFAQDYEPGDTSVLSNTAVVQAWDEANLVAHRDDPEMLALPGLLANRHLGQVELQVEATGLSGKSILEFLLIAASSGHAYEALFISYAAPSAVHQALEFIGMPAGAPFNPRDLRICPKGERVQIKLLSTNDAGEVRSLPLEQLVWDADTRKPLPAKGFVFSGSAVAPKGDSGEVEYAADFWEPKAVISIYNEPYSVMDVPVIRRKSEVYGKQLVNPAFVMQAGTLTRLILEPEFKDGRKRVCDVTLEIDFDKAAAGFWQHLNLFHKAQEANVNMRFRLQTKCDLPFPERSMDLAGVRRRIAALEKGGRDVFISARLPHHLNLGQAQAAARVLAELEEMGGLRIEPPEQDQIYFRAFLGRDEWRRRENRVGQPWELHVSQKEPAACELVLVEEETDSDFFNPTLRVTEFNVANSRDLRNILERDGSERKKQGLRSRMPVVMVFAEASFNYGQLVALIRPLLDLKYVIYIYLEQEQP